MAQITVFWRVWTSPLVCKSRCLQTAVLFSSDREAAFHLGHKAASGPHPSSRLSDCPPPRTAKAPNSTAPGFSSTPGPRPRTFQEETHVDAGAGPWIRHAHSQHITTNLLPALMTFLNRKITLTRVDSQAMNNRHLPERWLGRRSGGQRGSAGGSSDGVWGEGAGLGIKICGLENAGAPRPQPGNWGIPPPPSHSGSSPALPGRSCWGRWGIGRVLQG